MATESSIGSSTAPIEPVCEVRTTFFAVTSSFVSPSVIDLLAVTVTWPLRTLVTTLPSWTPPPVLVRMTPILLVVACTSVALIVPPAVTRTLPLVDSTDWKPVGPVGSPRVIESSSEIVMSPLAWAPSVPMAVRRVMIPSAFETALTRAVVAKTLGEVAVGSEASTSPVAVSVTTPFGAETVSTKIVLVAVVPSGVRVVRLTLLAVDVTLLTVIAEVVVMRTLLAAVTFWSVSGRVPMLSMSIVEDGADADSDVTWVSRSTRPDLLERFADAAITSAPLPTTASVRFEPAASVTEPLGPASAT